MTCWLGVDVGVRKGLDAAVVDEQRLVYLHGALAPQDLVGLIALHRPFVVAVDSPKSFALPGESARVCELALNRAVCGIRWTPDEPAVRASAYYSWILSGRDVYDALARAPDPDLHVIEVFPTASWTRWYGERAGRTRARWSAEALRELGLCGVPERTNQDQRDAIAAAVTARQYSAGQTEAFGEIVVPARRRADATADELKRSESTARQRRRSAAAPPAQPIRCASSTIIPAGPRR